MLGKRLLSVLTHGRRSEFGSFALRLWMKFTPAAVGFIFFGSCTDDVFVASPTPFIPSSARSTTPHSESLTMRLRTARLPLEGRG
jgi:hypothetical protein